jgi:indolepyruvate ferredoxin oxidoreductase beta subunit
VRTTTVAGFLRVWLLARLRPLRRVSYRAREEHARIARWLEAVRTCAGLDPALAVEVARAGQLVKGYGDVRRRMLAVHEQILAAVLAAARADAGRGQGFAASTALAGRLRAAVLAGPEGEAQVPQLAAAALESLSTR